MKKPTYYNKILFILRDIKKKYPQYNMGRHLATALDGQDMWGVTDKEIFDALEVYLAELEFDIPHPYIEKDIDKIVYEGTHLYKLFENEEDNDV